MTRCVLFADNNPDFLDTRAEFLEDAGYWVLNTESDQGFAACCKNLFENTVLPAYLWNYKDYT